MRLLIDANLSPRVAVALGKAGLESVHVCEVGLLTAPDRSILDQVRGASPVLQGGVSPGPAVRPGAAAGRRTA